MNMNKYLKGSLKAQVVTRLLILMVVAILGVGCLLPILAQCITGAGLSGFTATIVSYFSVIIACMILIYVVMYATG